MRWHVLVVQPWVKRVEPLLDVLSRSGVDASWECVDTRPALLAALEREEWQLVVYDPAVTEIPIEDIYAHAPAAAVVVATSPEDTADEIARIVASRDD